MPNPMRDPAIYIDRPVNQSDVRVTLYSDWNVRQSPEQILTFTPAAFLRLQRAMNSFVSKFITPEVVSTEDTERS